MLAIEVSVRALVSALLAGLICSAPAQDDALAQVEFGLGETVSGRSDTAKQAREEARKDREDEHKPADPDTGRSTLSDETLGVLKNPWQAQGIKFSASYVGEVLGNVSGGLRRGVIYEGRLNLAVDLDLARLAGLSGLAFHANLFQIHGPGLSRNYVGNLLTVSGIEALATTRLYEAWFEQQFGSKRLTLRAGQLAADTEFATTRYSDVFINSTFGWPGILGTNLPSGGPSPPLAAVGARLKAELSGNVTVMGAVFDGDPAGPGPDEPQSRNRYGVNFRTDDAPLALAELQYAYNQQAAAGGLPGTIKVGGWYHAGRFGDQRFTADGLPLAIAASGAAPLQHHGDAGWYSVFEQLLLAFPGGDGKRGLGIFLRGGGNPSDRNLIDLYADGGFNLAGAIASRPADKIGLGFAYARISNRAREFDRDAQAADGRPVRSYEALLTLSYLAEIRQGWTVLPNVQYVIHPGGGYVSDTGTPRHVRNALVLGVRSVAKF